MPTISNAIRAAAAAAALAAGATAGVVTATAGSAQADVRASAGGGANHEHGDKIERRGRHRRTRRHVVSHHRRHRKPEPVRTTTTTTTPTTTTTTTTPTTTTTTTTRTTPTTTTTATTPTTTTTTTTTTSATGGPVQPNGVSGNWNLIFDDEFNGTSLDTSTWSDAGYTNNNMSGGSQASDVSESGGDLILQVGANDSGAQVESISAPVAVGDFAEASVDFAGSGTQIDNWPAWWISGPNWPAAGENDIAEGLGDLTVNYHSPSGAHNQGTVPGTWAGGFHTYGIYRGANYCDVYWDGKLVKTYPTDDNGQPERLIFTNGPGNQIVPGATGEMKVDYVRVWS